MQTITGTINKALEYKAITQEKEATPTKEIQEITPDEGYDGISKMTIKKIPDEYIIPTGSIEITSNGIHDVTDKASAIVKVAEKKLGTKSISQTGVKTVTYNASDDNLDGYNKVDVTTSGVDINEYFETVYEGTTPNGWVKSNFIKKIPNLFVADSVTSLKEFCKGFPFDFKITCNSNVTNMNSMFNATGRNNIDVSGLNTSNVTNMNSMFANSIILTNLDLSNFNTNNVTNMSYMFYDCENLQDLDLSNFNTNNVTDMSYMFYGCRLLTNLDLSNFNTNNVTDMSYMFYGCRLLTNLDIRNFNFTNVTSYNGMFDSIPANCLIIVKNDTAKEWLTSKFTRLTNVKTITELGQ